MGTCKDYLIPPGVQILLCPFLPRPVEPLCRGSPSPSASWLPAAVYLQAACLALLLPGIGENHTPSLFSTMSFLKVVLFSGLPGVRRNSTDLKCHVPCNWISLSFLLLPYLSLFPFPQESYPKIASQLKVFSGARDHFRYTFLISASTLDLPRSSY